MSMLGDDHQELHDIVVKQARQQLLTQPGPVIPS